MIPAHMRKIGKTDYYYGKLKPETNCHGRVVNWIVKAEPIVIQTVKRLFPGSSGRGAVAKFSNTRRIMEDLNWLMLRYPLEIEDSALWESTYTETLVYTTRKRENLAKPQKALPPPEFKGELREFQKEGLAYLLHNERALLADEMGLGKTIQALAYLAKEKLYPAIVVAPPHLIKNWQKEINRFVTQLSHTTTEQVTA